MSALDFKTKKLCNARDLGGIPVSGDRVVKFGKLIRSNSLSDAGKKEIEQLERSYDLGLVIDLRSPDEIKKHQDPMYWLPCVMHVDIPLTQGNAIGIERRGSVAEVLTMAKMVEGDPIEMMEDMYIKIVVGKHGREAISMIFGLLLESDGLCILWHCSAGKDRAGIVAALILLALGASYDEVIEDYVKTNANMKRFDKAMNRKLIISPKKVKEHLPIVQEANPAFLDAALKAIDEQYGSIDNYFHNEIGLTDAMLDKLRELYTEPKSA